MSLARARIEGSLLGTMTGDSLGPEVESLGLGQLRDRFADERELAALIPRGYGAATEMTVAMAVSLARFPDFNPEDVACELARSASAERRYGYGTMAAIERLRAGVPWRSAASMPGGRTSFGNGAAVRSSPIAFLYAEDAETLRWVAEEAASITHSRALAGEGAVLQAAAVAMAGLHASRPLDPVSFLLAVGAEAEMREFRSRYESAARLVERDASAHHMVEGLGNGRSALGSVVTAAYCFARHPDDFERAVVAALALGGNASAIAAMTGAISGARLGASGIPERWLDRLEHGAISVDSMRGLAAELAGVAHRVG